LDRKGKLHALRISIIGLVQGVGFRPFVYRLATSLGLKGYVRNLGGSEVEILIEGEKKKVQKFLLRLRKEKPPPAEIEDISIERVPPKGFRKFRILKSGSLIIKRSVIPPDLGICDHCLSEVLNPNSRWYKYPFNSCAWCGPRFTMMYGIPYDRYNTSMRDFPLCVECRHEYQDPDNIRRFHAQGISCPKCGPKIVLIDMDGSIIEVSDPIGEAAKLIDEGVILGVKGLGGFHIATLASNDDVVLELRRRKRRKTKPFALMALDLNTASRLVVLNRIARRLLTSPSRPILVLPKRPDAPVSKYVAPNLHTLGVMLPYTALHYLLLEKTRDRFLVMTSGNKRGLPISISEKTALKELKGIVEYLLVHNRVIVNRCDDSVLRFTLGDPTFLRRSRGYAPYWLHSPLHLSKPVIAFGADLSSAGAIGFDRYIVQTQYIGDLDNVETIEYLESALNFLIKCYKIDISDSILVSDKHPLYRSSEIAKYWSELYQVPLFKVQHHHAHILSAMVELGIPRGESIIGIAIDGIGYGDDGRIWGGEVLRVEYGGYKRVGHLRYVPMPGGDLAVKYPVRMLVGFLSTFMNDSEVVDLITKLQLHKGLRYGVKEIEIVLKSVRNRKTPITSSMGRTLDAISSLLGLCTFRDYEGEPAIVLEEHSVKGRLIDHIHFPISSSSPRIIDTCVGFENVLTLLGDYKSESIGYTFQFRLGETLAEVAIKELDRCSISDLVLVSGGAAVNNIILSGIKSVLSEHQVKLYVNRKVPPGDGGIAIGQVVAGFIRSG